MSLTLKRFQIFESGTHRDNNGRTAVYPESLLQKTVEEYNQRKGKGAGDTAPLYIGHPPPNARRSFKPLGFVERLEYANGKIFAHAYVTPELFGKVKSGALRAVSAGFTKMKNFVLDHVAFLNNPSLKNMEALNFSENAEADYLIFTREFIDFSEPQNDHERVTAYAALHGVSYEQAAHMVLGGGSLVAGISDFSESGSPQEGEAHKLHRLAQAYQRQYGGSYENAVRACIHQTHY
ncbi:hypothetical protein [Neisseria animalis]|uniref:Uncharacterized protein n=1 Tax=Neisseria animalis TaxID=492 RepID=A0A5P3MT50_NEIAN|nr:hypothetical protein [Neisseria animalis]QEY23819.1 hypothetical protein D0T90_04290 [Neisseria animalis]ROW31598.1 hypothetical protein CGZ60_09490 [Neisseria animalis]VEE09790.1 Uncharacterised protein [Neisseria animalis]